MLILRRHFSSKIQDLLTNSELIGQKIQVQGWVKSCRLQKSVSFLDIDDGLLKERLQVVSETWKIPSELSYHSAVKVEGILKKSQHKGDFRNVNVMYLK